MIPLADGTAGRSWPFPTASPESVATPHAVHGPAQVEPTRSAPMRFDAQTMPDALVARAQQAADRVAAQSGLSVHPISDPTAARTAMQLFCDVWRTSERDAPVSADLMVALAHSGGYVAGAYDGDRLVGASVAFLGQGAALHSHISGVCEGARGRNVGHALKLHQRAWALERGIGCVTWTFDPLVRRNAWFNLAKLCASGRKYLPNFYGAMRDGVNVGEQSDRLLALWDLTTERVAASAEGVWLAAEEGVLLAKGAQVALDEDADGRPVSGRGSRSDPTHLLLRVPQDVERLRQEDSDAAASWRPALREALAGPLDQGWSATSFTRTGCYVLTPPA